MNKLKVSLLVLLLAGFTAIPACGGDEDPTSNDEQDAGHDVGDDAGEDTGEDADANGENGGELKENGEPCSCSVEPRTSMRCDDECQGGWCYTPHAVGEEAYCHEKCDTNLDCEEEGWYCDSFGCLDEDRV